MNRTDVYYRDAPPPPPASTSSDSSESSSTTDDGGFLPPLLGGLFQSLKIDIVKRSESDHIPRGLFAPLTILETRPPNVVQTQFIPPSSPSAVISSNLLPPPTIIAPSAISTNLHAPKIVTVTALTTVLPASPHIVFVENAQQHESQPIGFSGIFFRYENLKVTTEHWKLIHPS